jgi:hypothetical protein
VAGTVKHSCGHYSVSCFGCRPCDEHRLTHRVPTSAGMVQVERCSHCDGPDAHITVRPDRGAR